jgi:sensor domain CHASE-containing protein
MRIENSMAVRRKTIVIIAITYLGLMAVVYAAARTAILGNARQDEELSGNRNMQRILDVLDERTSALDRFSLDRSTLDGTYDFVARPGRKLKVTLFGDDDRTSPAARRAGFLILLDNSGRILAR